MQILLLTIPFIACFGWVAASLLLAWENRRFALSRMKEECKIRRREHRTALFVPCKGEPDELENNLPAFFTQQHPNYELVLVVESTDDAAWPVIQKLRSRYPDCDSRVVVAGVAVHDGQKVHNLRAATEDIDPNVKLLAFADADICPKPDWLHTLCIIVCKCPNVVANTGYRWMLPKRNSIANLFLYSINARIAGLMGPGGHLMVWGGAWAIRRRHFDRLEVRDQWKGTLSDDLVATRLIKHEKQDITFDPRCLSPTQFDSTWSAAVEFLRRQYLIGRKYAPKMFYLSWLVCFLNFVSWWGLCVSALVFSGTTAGFWLTVSAVALYTANLMKGVLRQSVFHRRDQVLFKKHRLAAAFDVIATPLVMTVNFVMISVAMFGNRICWRGNHYQINAGGQIELLRVDPEATVRSPFETSSSESNSNRVSNHRRAA